MDGDTVTAEKSRDTLAEDPPRYSLHRMRPASQVDNRIPSATRVSRVRAALARAFGLR